VDVCPCHLEPVNEFVIDPDLGRDPPPPPQRDHRSTCACADQGRDVVAHFGEGIAAAGPSLIEIVPRDQIDAAGALAWPWQTTKAAAAQMSAQLTSDDKRMQTSERLD
jgi:hypothetical protein